MFQSRKPPPTRLSEVTVEGNSKKPNLGKNSFPGVGSQLREFPTLWGRKRQDGQSGPPPLNPKTWSFQNPKLQANHQKEKNPKMAREYKLSNKETNCCPPVNCPDQTKKTPK
ncbi:hypothetical protein JTE90_007316 [Oedothorax gibbosus]|uniref:Uncharacterized protein n=1 Tax=Oedothorax gibbosus TaxID=931172 RepID=A0AAV6TCC8_9ARAC|nr:hypothetical protein JTE90_007316 [Oedothorax gibbosus]